LMSVSPSGSLTSLALGCQAPAFHSSSELKIANMFPPPNIGVHRPLAPSVPALPHVQPVVIERSTRDGQLKGGGPICAGPITRHPFSPTIVATTALVPSAAATTAAPY